MGMNSPEYDQGYQAYIDGKFYSDNPYYWPDQCEVPEQDWLDWASGWCEGEWQFGYYDA